MLFLCVMCEIIFINGSFFSPSIDCLFFFMSSLCATASVSWLTFENHLISAFLFRFYSSFYFSAYVLQSSNVKCCKVTTLIKYTNFTVTWAMYVYLINGHCTVYFLYVPHALAFGHCLPRNCLENLCIRYQLL